MISDIEEFIKQFHSQRRQTQWAVDAVPEEKADWSPWADEPTPAEIIRRIGAGHLMYATMVAHEYWYVEDYETQATSWEASVLYFQQKTEEALDLLRPLPNSVLTEDRRRPDENNIPIKAWRYLVAMLEHEISHRAQLNMYLMLMNARRPRMGGVSIESVRDMLEKLE